MQISDFPEVDFWHFSKKFKTFLASFPVSFFAMVFVLDYVWRPQLSKIPTKVSHYCLEGGEFLSEKVGSRDFRMTSSGLEKNNKG